MDDRKLQVLRAIVTDYVSSQEPVGSKALVDRHDLGVSPATVRNDMAALEEEGYITQPHTSAGRIPTDKGYRLFVDRLGSVKPLSPAEQRAIQTFLSGAHRPRRRPAPDRPAAGPGDPAGGHRAVPDDQPLRRSGTSRRWRCRRTRVLLILITSTGRIEQRALELPGHDESVLAELRAHLNAADGRPRRHPRPRSGSAGWPASCRRPRSGRPGLHRDPAGDAQQRDLEPGRRRRDAQPDPVRRRVRDHRTAGAGGAGGAGGAAHPARRGHHQRPGDWSGSARRTRTRSCSRRRSWPAATAPRLTPGRRWESSARPEWTIPRPWPRSAPSRVTSAGSSPKDDERQK